MRGLFIDLDGVAHPVTDIADLQRRNVSGPELDAIARERNLFRWLPVLTAALEDHPDVVIAVHSSWRKIASNSQLRDFLGPLAERFIGITDVASARHQGIVDLAARAGINDYKIIDDAVDEFPGGCAELVATDPLLGLSQPGVLDGLSSWLDMTRPAPAHIAQACR